MFLSRDAQSESWEHRRSVHSERARGKASSKPTRGVPSAVDRSPRPRSPAQSDCGPPRVCRGIRPSTRLRVCPYVVLPGGGQRRWATAMSSRNAQADGFEHPGAADVRHVAEAEGRFGCSGHCSSDSIRIATSGVPLTRVFACTCDDDCPADWEATGEPYTMRTTAIMETNVFIDWSHRFRAWDLGAFLRFTNIFGHSNRWSYLGTVQGCSSRVTLPCSSGQEQTDIMPAVTLRHRDPWFAHRLLTWGEIVIRQVGMPSRARPRNGPAQPLSRRT
jgi:hypothetical protein